MVKNAQPAHVANLRDVHFFTLPGKKFIYKVSRGPNLECEAIDGQSFLQDHYRSVFMNEDLYCISEDDLKVVRYNVLIEPNEIRGETIGEYKKSSKGFSATNFKDKAIIIIGGKRSLRTAKTVLSFCPIKKSYAKLPGLNDSRHSHAACVLDGKMYVFGGLTKIGSYVKSVERIDLVA